MQLFVSAYKAIQAIHMAKVVDPSAQSTLIVQKTNPVLTTNASIHAKVTYAVIEQNAIR
jgi:hypothetical protein